MDVIERATGNKESAVDISCQFTSSPYLIEYINTPKYFKPGLRYVVKVFYCGSHLLSYPESVADPGGRAQGGQPPLCLGQTEAQRTEKMFLGDRAPPPPPPLPLISRSGSGTVSVSSCYLNYDLQRWRNTHLLSIVYSPVNQHKT